MCGIPLAEVGTVPVGERVKALIAPTTKICKNCRFNRAITDFEMKFPNNDYTFATVDICKRCEA
jgi:hypothetical protein